MKPTLEKGNNRGAEPHPAFSNLVDDNRISKLSTSLSVGLLPLVPSLPKKIGVISAFVLLAVVTLINAVVTRGQLASQVEKRHQVAHSQDVLLAITQAISSLKDAETGQRGYLYTGNPTYLEPYNKATVEVRGNLQRLADLVRDNPEQEARVAQMQVLAEQKLAELASTVSLAQAGSADEARSLVLTNTGKRTMDQIRDLATAMWNTETNLETARSVEYARSTRNTAASIYAATLAAILALVLVGFYILRNLQQRETYAAALYEREQWFRVTLNSIGDGVIATDESGCVMFVNEVAEQLIGIAFAEAKKKPIEEVFPIFNENTRQTVANPIAKVLSEGKVVGMANHTILKRRDGTFIPIEDSAAPIRNDQGKIVGVVLVFRDATQERHAQDLLRRAEKLATAGRLAATMAHEINNPLEAVGNLIYIAKTDEDLKPQTREHLELVEEQLARVSHITRQTLGFYRESAERSEVHIPALVDSVLKLYGNRLKTKGITVERNFREHPPIYGLLGELRQMMANLIANAVDALPTNGRLTISSTPHADEDGTGVEIRVADNGQGIPPENHHRVFEPFFTTKKDVGTGLGLWVAKEIAERHGGTIRLVSNGDQQGAVFSIFLPSQTVAREAANA